jgi:hypothetical protein
MKYLTMRRGLMLAMATMAVATACSNPVSPGTHLVAAGVVIRDGDRELVRAVGTTVTGGLTIEAGQQTGPLTVQFLAANGSEIPVQQGYWLDVRNSNPAVAQWTRASQAEFGGRLVGLAPGQTTMTFANMHGAVGSGHDDGMQAVTVTVTAAP